MEEKELFFVCCVVLFCFIFVLGSVLVLSCGVKQWQWRFASVHVMKDSRFISFSLSSLTSQFETMSISYTSGFLSNILLVNLSLFCSSNKVILKGKTSLNVRFEVSYRLPLYSVELHVPSRSLGGILYYKL